MSTFSALSVGSVFAGDYRVIRPLAEGGMGAVYVVEQVSTGKQRALKVMHPTLVPDERSRARFAEEARLGARIESEHVVEVLGAGVDVDTGMPWLCMELLEGSSFEQLVQERGALPPSEVLELLEEACHALAEAHRQGIIHRDLKPENLFLARSRRKGARANQVKILDFGIARTVEQSRTAATVTTAIGSPLWMAPEQAQAGAKLRPSTDVWALGLIAFTLLTRRTFWLTSNAPEFNLSALLVELMVQPIPAPSARAAELGFRVTLPPGFDAWFLRCVERDPAMRFPDAGQAFSALASVLGPGEPAGPTAPTQAMPSVRTAPMPSTPSTMVLSEAERASATTNAGPRPMALRMGLVGAAGAAAVAVAVLAFGAAGAFDGGEPTPRRATGEPVAPAVRPPAPPEPQPAGRVPVVAVGSRAAPPRDPFADPLPDDLRTIAVRVARVTPRRELSRGDLGALSRWDRDHPGDPRAALLIAHAFANQRSLTLALSHYQRAYGMDETVRGDPQMLPDLLEAVRSNIASLSRDATLFIVDAYDAEARGAVNEAIVTERRPPERGRLEELREALLAPPDMP